MFAVICASFCTALPTRGAEPKAPSVLEADWLFQANNRPTANRINREIAWTRELAARISKAKSAPDLKAELTELARIEALMAVAKMDTAAVNRAYLNVRRAKRKITFKNPVIDFSKVLLIDNPLPGGREWGHEARHRNGFMGRNGGRLLVLEGLDPDAKVRDLAATKTPGAFWRPDLSFDAKKVVFSMKPHNEIAFHLYEVGADGKGLTQLTKGDYDDLDPIYLPDGHLMFSTSRTNTYIRCMPYTYAYALARCDADGKNIYIISRNSETDYLPSLLNDGRIIYSRWEYTDKALWRVQSLWTVNPDGTNVTTFWGNQSVWPDHLTEPRAIPGSRKIMFTGVGHHAWFNGSIGIIDPDKGLNFPHGLSKVTAEVRWPECGNGPTDPVLTDKYHTAGQYAAYKTPYPLSEEDFLVSIRSAPKGFALYLMDIYGNRELIYKGEHNAYHAMPFKPRDRPPMLPDRVAWPGTGKKHIAPKNGVLFSNNVFQGAPKLPKDKVKYLRVIEMDHKTYSTWSKTVQADGPAVSISQADSVKRVLGTVPIESDGSVNFELPPGKAVYFQLLDAQYRCIQNMRSFTGVMPGEVRGCLGCHELQNSAETARQLAGQDRGRALKKAPAKLTAPAWGSETVGFERFVQPVLNKYCAKCHMGKGKARKKLDYTPRPSEVRWRFTVGQRPGDVSPFNEPYISLVGGRFFRWSTAKIDKDKDGIPMSLSGCLIVEGFSRNDPNSLKTLPPMTVFSHKSKLIKNAMDPKHHKTKVDALSIRRLIAWVDCNGPYLGREEMEAMYDPQFPGVDKLQVRPRMGTAPRINRFNIRQDGDSQAVAGPLKLAPAKLITEHAGKQPGPQPGLGDEPPSPPRTLPYTKLISVIYGYANKRKDITAAVSKLADRSGNIRIRGKYSELFGDPARGSYKELVITYESGGKKRVAEYRENSTFMLQFKK